MNSGAIDIAFLDSGTGGIPYMLELKKKNPFVRCVYLGDTAHFPYGEKTPEEVESSSAQVISQIIKLWSPKAIVVACNTISVTALDFLRRKFPDRPIVGTVPAIKVAAKVTKNKKIGLLATNATVRHPYCQRLISDFASDCQVFSRGDPDLISFIEHDLFTASHEEKIAAVKPAVDFFLSKGCDSIILGCTHFTHVAKEIEEAAGPGVMVVDSRDGVANQALRVSELSLSHSDDEKNISAEKNDLPLDETFFVTALRGEGDEKEYAALCSRFSIPWGGLLENKN